MGKARKPSRHAQPRHQLPPAKTVNRRLGVAWCLLGRQDPGQTHRGQNPPPNTFTAGFANKVPFEKHCLAATLAGHLQGGVNNIDAHARAQLWGGAWQPQVVVLAGGAEDAEVGERASEDPQV